MSSRASKVVDFYEWVIIHGRQPTICGRLPLRALFAARQRLLHIGAL